MTTKSKSLFMETTKIAPSKTVGEIERLLALAGARRVTKEFYPDGDPKAVAFTLEVEGREVPFMLPARVDPVFRYFQEQRSPSRRESGADADMEQAVRVAWRQIFRWIQAQIAMIETGMVESAEVFMPYVQVSNSQTLFDKFKLDASRMLSDGSQSG